VYAEDPRHGFVPSPGRLLALELPAGGRVDCGVAEGETIGTRYDPMIAKLVAHGETRDQARGVLLAALRATSVLGVHTNVEHLMALLDDGRVRAGELDTELAERIELAADPDGRERAALVAGLAHARDDDDVFVRLGPWRLHGERPSLRLLSADGHRLLVERGGAVERWTAAGEWVGHEGRSWRLGRDDAAGGGEQDRELRAPMPGAVVAVERREGERVARGDVVVVLESMKMELQIAAAADGVLEAVHVAAGDQVALGDVLARVAAA
jgi:acetyl-CoA/propionyl-CoA carboxylase biotin carboxyl carrier protein